MLNVDHRHLYPLAVLCGITAVAIARADSEQPAVLEAGRHAMIPHDHSPETTAKLKEAIPTFQNVPDNVLHMIMKTMREDYAWYISPDATTGKVGVLMLNHGVSEESDQAFRKSLTPIAGRQPTAIGYGMAMTTGDALQQAVDELNARGVDTIVAVDPDTSMHKSLYRQWRYILGLSDKAAYVAVPQIHSKARILLAAPVNDSPLVGQILLDHAKEQSRNPAKEAVVIIAHGPEDNEDNPGDLAEVKKLAAWVQKKGKFARVDAHNIQDDAPAPVRAANVKIFRGMATAAQAQGLEVIVVPYVINAKGLQPKLQHDLEGLNFRFQEKGISDHPNFVKWINATVSETLKNAK
jgi:sirohydrochlorin ferrochelatase